MKLASRRGRSIALAACLACAGMTASAASFQADTDGTFDFALGSYGNAGTFNLTIGYDLFEGDAGALFGYADTPTLQTLKLGGLTGSPVGGTTDPGLGGYLHHYTFTFLNVGAGSHDLSLFGVNGGTDKTTLLTNFSATVAAVPEPGSYALMLAGLGAIGFMSRRRRG